MQWVNIDPIWELAGKSRSTRPSIFFRLKHIKAIIACVAAKYNIPIEQALPRRESDGYWVPKELEPSYRQWVEEHLPKKQRKKQGASESTSKTKSKEKPTSSVVEHVVNGFIVQQRIVDGFINGTAMCVAHGKKISNWLKADETWELVQALAEDLKLKAKCPIWGISDYTRVSATYPDLVIVKEGAPANGGGTWLHPDLAMQLAQWCNPVFAIQVSRWVRQWITLLEEQRRAEEEKRNDLKAIKACVLPEPKKWEAQFPPEFWEKLKLITGRPQSDCSWLTKYIYARFPKGVHKAIPSQNPRDSAGNRKQLSLKQLTHLIEQLSSALGSQKYK